MNEKRTVPEILAAAADTFGQRNPLYKDTYKQFGPLLLELFNGEIPAVNTPEDSIRMSLIINCLGKLKRYANNFRNGGHIDSAHDLIVYAAMLEENTRER